MQTIAIKKPKLDYYSAEALKSLRTNLLFCGEDKKVIVFTSCTQNEGKTYCMLNLGIALSEIGKRVLVIDADLRKSVLLGRVQVSGTVNGLAHYLSKQCPLKDVIYETGIRNFHMIFAGSMPPNPAELLSNKYFDYLISTAREHYDYILIDSPPLGNVIDSAVIAPKCDGTIIVVESGWNSWRFVQDIKEQRVRTGIPILGVILNKVDIHTGKYYGKYGKYGKYGRYGKYGKYGQYGRYGFEADGAATEPGRASAGPDRRGSVPETGRSEAERKTGKRSEPAAEDKLRSGSRPFMKKAEPKPQIKGAVSAVSEATPAAADAVMQDAPAEQTGSGEGRKQ